MGTAPKLAEEVATHTHLLDAVLSGDFFAPPRDKDALAAELARLNGQARDYQDRLDIARRWQHEREFQVAVQLLKGALDARAAVRPSPISPMWRSRACWPIRRPSSRVRTAR